MFADDPYYCGLRARVPNFVKIAKNGHSKVPLSPYVHIKAQPQPVPAYVPVAGYAPNTHHSQSSQIYGQHNKRPPIMYHARSFESGLGTYVLSPPSLTSKCLPPPLSSYRHYSRHTHSKCLAYIWHISYSTICICICIYIYIDTVSINASCICQAVTSSTLA